MRIKLARPNLRPRFLGAITLTLTIILLLLVPFPTLATALATSAKATPTPTRTSTPQHETVTKTPPPTPTLPPLRTFNGPPTLSATAALAIDADTGQILYAKNPYEHLPQASTTKILTALTLFTIPGFNLNDYTTVVQDDLVGEANMGLYAGLRLKVVDLLYGLMLDSANDAAMSLARYGGEKLAGYGDPVDKFVGAMNQEAASLGLENTYFQNPHGLDTPDHYSSASDLAIAGWYALQNPTLASIVKQSNAQLDGYQFYNINNFIRRYPGATGVKPGQTDDAGLCLVASATREGHNAIIVLLNSPQMVTESSIFMDYAFSQIINQEQSQQLNSAGLDLAQQEQRQEVDYIGTPVGNRLLLTTSNMLACLIISAARLVTNDYQLQF